MAQITPAGEAEAHRQVLNRAAAYIRALPPELFVDDAMSRAAIELCGALVDAVRAAWADNRP